MVVLSLRLLTAQATTVQGMLSLRATFPHLLTSLAERANSPVVDHPSLWTQYLLGMLQGLEGPPPSFPWDLDEAALLHDVEVRANRTPVRCGGGESVHLPSAILEAVRALLHEGEGEAAKTVSTSQVLSALEVASRRGGTSGGQAVAMQQPTDREEEAGVNGSEASPLPFGLTPGGEGDAALQFGGSHGAAIAMVLRTLGLDLDQRQILELEKYQVKA